MLFLWDGLTTHQTATHHFPLPITLFDHLPAKGMHHYVGAILCWDVVYCL